MNEREETELYQQLLDDESKRDRGLFDYTVDALMELGIMQYSIWPESNQNVAGVISGEINYDFLPVDEENEFYKGTTFTEQQDIILRNNGKEPLCEAQDIKPCLKEECVLYNSKLGPPVCREFKIAFKIRRNP